MGGLFRLRWRASMFRRSQSMARFDGIIIARSRRASGRTPVCRRAFGDVAIHGIIGLRRELWIATLRSR